MKEKLQKIDKLTCELVEAINDAEENIDKAQVNEILRMLDYNTYEISKASEKMRTTARAKLRQLFPYSEEET